MTGSRRGARREALEIVERRGRRTAFALVMGWLAAGIAAASVEGAAGLWLMSLPFGVFAIGASLARRRVVRIDGSGLTVRDVPFGPGYTLPRADIAYVTANGGPGAGWSVVVRTTSGESRRLAGGRLSAEHARAIADRVQSSVR